MHVGHACSASASAAKSARALSDPLPYLPACLFGLQDQSPPISVAEFVRTYFGYRTDFMVGGEVTAALCGRENTLFKSWPPQRCHSTTTCIPAHAPQSHGACCTAPTVGCAAGSSPTYIPLPCPTRHRATPPSSWPASASSSLPPPPWLWRVSSGRTAKRASAGGYAAERATLRSGAAHATVNRPARLCLCPAPPA